MSVPDRLIFLYLCSGLGTYPDVQVPISKRVILIATLQACPVPVEPLLGYDLEIVTSGAF